MEEAKSMLLESLCVVLSSDQWGTNTRHYWWNVMFSDTLILGFVCRYVEALDHQGCESAQSVFNLLWCKSRMFVGCNVTSQRPPQRERFCRSSLIVVVWDAPCSLFRLHRWISSTRETHPDESSFPAFTLRTCGICKRARGHCGEHYAARTANFLEPAYMDVLSWRSWFLCATWTGCRYSLTTTCSSDMDMS